MCKTKFCKNLICDSFHFCIEHSKKEELYNSQISIDEYNQYLTDYWKYLPISKYGSYYDEFLYFDDYDDFKNKVLELKFNVLFNEIATELNKNISRKDSNNLLCTAYCSEGYCNCDLMPRIEHINYEYSINRNNISKNTDNEDVYYISPKARVDSDYEPYYMAWTIPKIFIDELKEIWDGTKEYIEKMIEFEYVY
jgi:hypothetical protein